MSLMDQSTSPAPESSVSPDRAAPITPSSISPSPNEQNESFLGGLLVVLLLIIVVGVIAFFSVFGYQLWRDHQAVKNTPSIERMVAAKPTPPPAPASSETPPAEPAPSPAPTLDKATLEIKVMNGGAPRGSAGTFTETLKKAGYTKTTFGNTVGDFTGTTIYFADGKEAEAEVLKVDVAKTYPKVTTAKAVTTNKDTTGASLVVVLGK